MYLGILVFRSRSCSYFLSLYCLSFAFINIKFMPFILFIYVSFFHYVQLSLLCQGENVTLMV
jgi:hypothetical protein